MKTICTAGFRLICLALIPVIQSCGREPLPSILYPVSADPRVELAAREVRRYVYLRTGELLQISRLENQSLPDRYILLTVKGEGVVPDDFFKGIGSQVRELSPEAWFLHSSAVNSPLSEANPEKPARLVIAGGSPAGLLYGAYAFASKLGVRFYLHGDVIPDEKFRFRLPMVDEIGRPRFETRGIQPFHDFPEGPDWWTLGDYKAYFSQMVKMGMNFFGLHTYPEGGVGPEPLVWIGPEEDLNADGTVKSAYPARHFTNMNNTWAYTARPTSAYSHRLGELFEQDYYGTSYMMGIPGWPADSASEIQLFNRTGDFFAEAFTYAKGLGIKTCVGTETPLTVPEKVRKRHPGLTTVDLYKGMFEWIKRNYPIDYYWFWTPEDWTWSGNTPEHLKKTVDDLLAAQAAVESKGNPFSLATCGWVLGPVQDRSMFDRFLPKSWPMSCINQQVGFTPVDPGFARVTGRPLWAIPWMEDDPALTVMQLWAGRMRADAEDAEAYGCTGLIGIHWRTQTLQTNVGALAEAGWRRNTSVATPEAVKAATFRMSPAEADSNFRRASRDVPVSDFYADWANAQFGPAAGDSMAVLMNGLDGQEVSINAGGGKKTRLPRQGDWTGPGGVILDYVPWEERAADYRFVDRIESWRPLVKGKANLERFDYWLNFFRYHRAFGKFACSLGETERTLKNLEASGQPPTGTETDLLVSQRIRLSSIITEAMEYLLAYASTPGDLGTIANWQQHLLVYNVEGHQARIEKLTGKPLPPEALPFADFMHVKRLIVPTVRTLINRGESLPVTLLCYGLTDPAAVIRYRLLGAGEYREIPVARVNRGVLRGEIPAEDLTDDFEYQVVVTEANGQQHRWPATAPEQGQTVVVAGMIR